MDSLAAAGYRKACGPTIVDRQFLSALDIANGEQQYFCRGDRYCSLGEDWGSWKAEDVESAVGLARVIDEAKRGLRFELRTIFQAECVSAYVLGIVDHLAFDLSNAAPVDETLASEYPFANGCTSHSQATFGELNRFAAHSLGLSISRGEVWSRPEFNAIKNERGERNDCFLPTNVIRLSECE